jgi:RecB family exonuclease
VCATASLTSETEPDRHLVPSEYLMKLFFEDRRETLGSQQLAEVQRQSSAWLEKSRLFETEVTGDKSVAQTYRAYEARRDKTKKFEEYEFALKRAPQRPLSLPCKEWETALQDPGSVFLKRVLGVEPPRARTDEDRWSLTVGTWIHRWLRSAADPAGKRDFVKMPGPADFSRELRAAALTTQRAVAEAFAAAGRPMPRWWMAGWTEAVWKAGQLDTALAGLTDWAWFAAEWDLPDGVQAGALRLRGRIDLLLAHQPRADAGTLWVLDFKTGKTGTKLSAKKLAKGTGVQVALYALALQLLGATDVTASLVRPGEPIDAGLEHNEVAGATAVWETLAAMQNTGVFGMIGELRPEFGLPRTYPLATLAVDSETLGDKWALTHPKLQSEEDEE